MGSRSKEIATLPAVQTAMRDTTRHLMQTAKNLGAAHGTLYHHIDYEPIDGVDWCVYYIMIDEKGRGFGGPLEMGHYNVPRGGDWTRGTHVLRDAIRRCEVF